MRAARKCQFLSSLFSNLRGRAQASHLVQPFDGVLPGRWVSKVLAQKLEGVLNVDCFPRLHRINGLARLCLVTPICNAHEFCQRPVFAREVKAEAPVMEVKDQGRNECLSYNMRRSEGPACTRKGRFSEP